MKYLALALIIILPLSLFTAPASAGISTVCENCSATEYLTCAKAVGQQLPLHAIEEVLVADFPNWTMKIFQVWKEDTTQGGVVIRKGTESSDDLSSVDETPAGTIVTAIEVTPSVAEQVAINGSLEYVNNFLRAVGDGRVVHGQCALSRPGSSGSEVSSDFDGSSWLKPIVPGPRIVNPVGFTVPPDIAASAHEVIGNNVLGNAIGNHIAEMYPDSRKTDMWVSLLAIWQGMDVTFDTVFIGTFGDGSIGTWRFNDAMRLWEVDMSTLKDSEGNPIPLRRDDAIGSVYQFIGGVENMNVGLMRNRLENGLGFIISGTPSGGAACISTTFSCNDQGCTVTCRTK